MGVCLALAVAKIAQRPFGALARPVCDLGGFDSTDPIMLALYDRRSNGSSLGRAMLISFQLAIKASQGNTDIHGDDMNEFGMPRVTELFLLARLRPKGFMCFWGEFLDYEREGRDKALYYMLYQERLA